MAVPLTAYVLPEAVVDMSDACILTFEDCGRLPFLERADHFN